VTVLLKIVHGMVNTYKDEIISDLQASLFSMNIDEAKSKSYWSATSCHWRAVLYFMWDPSVSFVCLQRTLFDIIVGIMDRKEQSRKPVIHWKQIISVLMDSCNIIRVSKTRLEVRIWAKAPYLLDMDAKKNVLWDILTSVDYSLKVCLLNVTIDMHLVLT